MFTRHLFAIGFLIPLMALTASAQDQKKTTWEITRTTAPDTVEELRALESTVKQVIDKVTPATCAVLLGSSDPHQAGPQSVGAGSGVIVSADGYVLTAAHVVEPPSMLGFGGRRGRSFVEPQERPTTVQILLPGQIIVSAQILGRNPGIDSGIVKITSPVPENAKWPGAKEGKWPFVEIGESAKLSKGQWVLALGHPGGPKRDRRTPVRLGQVIDMPGQGVLVSDCALVGGDSGGPLFDLQGKLVGIHSRIGEKLVENIHVPTKDYRDEWKRLVRGDVIGRDGLGLGIVLTKGENAEPKIEKFLDDSPAEKAGLKLEDAVVKLNGHEVKSPTDFREIMSQYRANDLATILVRRDGELIETKVKVIRDGSRQVATRGVMGVRLNRKGNNEPKIEEFSTKSPAEKAGLKLNDVILKLNNTDIKTSEDVDKAMEQLRPNDSITVLVRRGEEFLEFQFKLTRPSPN